jgi:Tfp pilus assembly protein PilV
MKLRRPSSRGFGLFDAVVALSLLAFGLLALVRFQTKLSAQANESSQRANAAVLAEELLSSMLVDIGNANCYTLPAVTPCANPEARAATDAWQVRALARLPHASGVTSVVDAATSRITVTLNWYHQDASEARKHEVSSDIR